MASHTILSVSGDDSLESAYILSIHGTDIEIDRYFFSVKHTKAFLMQV